RALGGKQSTWEPCCSLRMSNTSRSSASDSPRSKYAILLPERESGSVSRGESSASPSRRHRVTEARHVERSVVSRGGRVPTHNGGGRDRSCRSALSPAHAAQEPRLCRGR